MHADGSPGAACASVSQICNVACEAAVGLSLNMSPCVPREAAGLQCPPISQYLATGPPSCEAAASLHAPIPA